MVFHQSEHTESPVNVIIKNKCIEPKYQQQDVYS